MTTPRRLLLSVIFLAGAGLLQAQTTYYYSPGSVAIPQWTQANIPLGIIWSATSGGSPTNYWTSGDDAVINTGNPEIFIGSGTALGVNVHNLTVTGGVTFLGTGSTASRTLTLTGAGSGTVTLSGNYTGTGNLIFSMGGTSAWNGQINIATNSSMVQVNSTATTGTATKVNMAGGRLNLTTAIVGGSATIGELSGTGGTIDASTGATTGVRTLEIDQATDTTFAGNIVSSSGNRLLAIEKAGSGTLTLTSTANTYQGGTKVSGGTLLVNNASGSGTGSGSVSVEAGATLGGTGIVTLAADNSVTVEGTLDVGGESAAAETFDINTSGTGALSLLDGAVVALDIWTNSLTGSDRLVTTGTVSLGSDVTLSLANAGALTFAQGMSFDLFDWGGTVSGTFSDLILPTLDDGLSWNTSQLYTTGILSVVPEPATSSLLAAGGVLWVLRRRRRQP